MSVFRLSIKEHGDTMAKKDTIKPSMIESYPPELSQELGLTGLSYEEAFNVLKKTDMILLYESNTGILTERQRKLFENFWERSSKELKAFLDPLIVSFAVHDACDSSDADYIWFDLTEGENISSYAWVKSGKDQEVTKLAIELLGKHLEKYLIDAYDRQAREGIANLWNTELAIPECWYCSSKNSMVRKIITVNDNKFRAWACTKCSHNTVSPKDILEYFKKRNFQ